MSSNFIQPASKVNTLEKIEPLVPDKAEIGVLDAAERIGFRLTHLMNLGVWKRLMTFGQRHIG